MAVPGISPDSSPLQDSLSRPLRSLRISVTDRCNLRCTYCMPEADYVWLPRRDILEFEEIGRVAAAFVSLGVDRIRLTGGEPLLRRDIGRLIAILAALPIRDLSLTTNGVLLDRHAAALRASGLARITISLDTLRPDRFARLAGRDRLGDVVAGIEAARLQGLAPLKLNAVVIRGDNDDELSDLIEFAQRYDAEVRFIEYMDVGGATSWSSSKVVPGAEIIRRLARRYGAIDAIHEPDSSAPAARYVLPDGRRFGLITSTTAPFCGACDRSRVTADGHWFTCLYATAGLDLRALLRAGASHDELAGVIRDTWSRRRDAGAVDRLAEVERKPLHARGRLALDPRLEMHTRGG